jgi:hypothetical protein
MSTSPGQYSKDALLSLHGPLRSDERAVGPKSCRPRPVARAVAIAERQTLTGALERVADRRPGLEVPEALYTDMSANVSTFMRGLVLTALSEGHLSTAAELCSALVRLMALQPMRRWLDPKLILRVALLIHEQKGQDLAMLTQVRELLSAQGRWHAAAIRHGAQVDAGDPEDWKLVREMNDLPLDFAPHLRGLIARSVIRQDLLSARAQLASFSRQEPAVADTARRQLNRHAPQLASLFGAELAPTRPMRSLRAEVELPQLSTAQRIMGVMRRMIWPTFMVAATFGVVAMLLVRPPAPQARRSAVESICRAVGAEHLSCLTAVTFSAGLEHGDCGLAAETLPILAEQLSNYGLNRELAVIRTDSLGGFRDPFNALEYSLATSCRLGG